MVPKRFVVGIVATALDRNLATRLSGLFSQHGVQAKLMGEALPPLLPNEQLRDELSRCDVVIVLVRDVPSESRDRHTRLATNLGVPVVLVVVTEMPLSSAIELVPVPLRQLIRFRLPPDVSSQREETELRRVVDLVYRELMLGGHGLREPRPSPFPAAPPQAPPPAGAPFPAPPAPASFSAPPAPAPLPSASPAVPPPMAFPEALPSALSPPSMAFPKDLQSASSPPHGLLNLVLTTIGAVAALPGAVASAVAEKFRSATTGSLPRAMPRIEVSSGTDRGDGGDALEPPAVAEQAPPPEPPTHEEPVFLGVTAPKSVCPGDEFTAALVAYIAALRDSAQDKLAQLGDDGDRRALDIVPGHAAWRVGAPVSVTITGERLSATPAVCSFEWSGKENVAAFAVKVDAGAPEATTHLYFNVSLDTVPIATIPMRLRIEKKRAQPPADPNRCDVKAPESAFASYASKDSDAVTARLSALAHWAPGVNIFQDCLDLRASEAFKPQLEVEIAVRDVFLLFWSRNAIASPWVQWELQTARAKKGLDAILPMPLEDPAIATPPPDFAERHLRDRFMLAGYGLQKIREIAAGTR